MSEATDIHFSSIHFIQQLSDFDKIEIFTALNDNRWSWTEAKAESELRWRTDIIRSSILKAVDQHIKNLKIDEVPEALQQYTTAYWEANKEKIKKAWKDANPDTNNRKGPKAAKEFDVYELLVGTSYVYEHVLESRLRRFTLFHTNNFQFDDAEPHWHRGPYNDQQPQL
jgi:hypothetical protein